ncbi:MAG TPA: LLM class F420-dependent oxidoreductase [Candidatus Micrarchaeia archaeon]|nr:LLM class F420-dependent oxidoreductase [Candidatus Micrarchaeia archaeon]
MRLRIFVEPQRGATYAQILAVAREAEGLGFDGFFRSDHYLTTDASAGWPSQSDSWTTLAGLARETSRLRLGTLVTAATFRLPGPLAVAVAQVDHMSSGRVELGLGAAWHEAEHVAFGIPFPPVGERFERLEEQLSILTGLWSTPEGEPFTFVGRHYRLQGNPAQVRPLQRPRPPIIVGGEGRPRTARIAARFADEFNVPFRPLEPCRAAFARVRSACEAIGRDPAGLRLSVALTVCCGATETEVLGRARAMGRTVGELAEEGVAGRPDEVAAALAARAAAGADTVYLQLLDLTDLDHLRLIAAEVAPQLAGIGPAR